MFIRFLVIIKHVGDQTYISIFYLFQVIHLTCEIFRFSASAGAGVTCFDDKQFPLKFGDGTTGDFSIEFIDLTLDQKIIVFAGYGYSNSTFTNIPIIGAYVKYDLIKKITWLKTLKSTQLVSRVSALALSHSQEYLLATVSNMFGLLILDAYNGQMIHSGISDTQTYDEIPNYGALMDKNNNIFVTYQTQTTQKVIIQKFSFDLKSTLWKQELLPSGKPSVIKYRESDEKIFALADYYYSSTSSFQRSFSLIKIDIVTAAANLWNIEFTLGDFTNAKTYDLRVEGNFAVGCYYSNQVAGYLAFNEQTSQYQMRHFSNGAGFLCLGVYLLPNSTFAFFYRLLNAGVQFRYWITYDPFNEPNDSFDLKTFDYSALYPSSYKFQYFKSVGWMNFYFIGNDGISRTKGFIESNFPEQTCRTPPVLSSLGPRNKLNSSPTMYTSSKAGVSNGFTNMVMLIYTVDTTKGVLTPNGYCSQPSTVTISNPTGYTTSINCLMNQPCNVIIGNYISPQGCTDAPQIVYTMVDTSNESFPIVYQQPMTADFVNITFNPGSQHIGNRQYKIIAQMLINGSMYTENSDVTFNITVQDICLTSFQFLNTPYVLKQLPGLQLLIYSSNVSYVGFYQISVTGTLQNQYQNQLYFDWRLYVQDPRFVITENTPPYFVSPLQKQVLTCNKKSQYTLPKTEDYEKDNILTFVDLGPASIFAVLEKSKFIFHPICTIGGSDTQIKITLQDDNKYSKSNIQFLQIQLKSEQEVNKCIHDKELTARISLVTNKGMVYVKFNKDIKNDTDTQFQIENNLKFRVIKAFGQGVQNIKSYKVASMTNRMIRLKVEYQNPQQISNLGDNSIIMTVIDQKCIKDGGVYLNKIPPQLLDSGILVQIFCYKKILGMLAILQVAGSVIITHLPLMAIQLPANAIFFYNLIYDISNFNLIPVDKMNELLFDDQDLPKDDPEDDSDDYYPINIYFFQMGRTFSFFDDNNPLNQFQQVKYNSKKKQYRLIVVQSFFAIMSSLLLMVFYLRVKPFENYSQSMIELFNEGCVLFQCYYMLLNTDNDLVSSTDNDLRLNLGWFTVGLTLLYLLVNTLIVLVQMFGQLSQTIKQKCKKPAKTQIYQLESSMNKTYAFEQSTYSFNTYNGFKSQQQSFVNNFDHSLDNSKEQTSNFNEISMDIFEQASSQRRGGQSGFEKIQLNPFNKKMSSYYNGEETIKKTKLFSQLNNNVNEDKESHKDSKGGISLSFKLDKANDKKQSNEEAKKKKKEQVAQLEYLPYNFD
ncbi:UNKNOWN [Stylonychia lemnae]|uniref:Uncharacterized protein n=1 Tax=Stylonychia lemnae TaxID=5949 RepID=A0A078ASF6_STYLE|nr:UNKNOWN [Stylonychia lemnae]|eukprot:CDW84916.1 UNKNOWN [Stylonychia lemnae]